MNHSWLRSTFAIASIFSFRMLGLFMLIPVFTLYAGQLHGATPKLIGFALGGYGLSQGLLQMPFGILSDKYGRRKLIAIGLFMFALGSLLGAWTHSIYGMILARLLQGSGAIGSVLMALLADLTPDQHRTKSMAVIGMSFGISFTLAMVISPSIAAFAGLSGIFYFTTVLALIGFIILLKAIPSAPIDLKSISTFKDRNIQNTLKNPALQRLNASIFCQHLILTATFFATPLILQQHIVAGNLHQTTQFYLPLLIGSFIAMVPILLFAERKQHIKGIFLIAVTTIGLAQAALAVFSSVWVGLCILLFMYFIAFNLLEAQLPSLVSKQADPAYKGTAMGIYSSSQFLGIFAGGVLAGIVYQSFGGMGIFIMNGCISLVWLLLAKDLKPNHYIFILRLACDLNKHNLKDLENIPGVIKVRYSDDEQAVYLHIQKNNYIDGSAEKVLQ